MWAAVIIIDIVGTWLGSDILAAMMHPLDAEKRAQIHGTNAARILDLAGQGVAQDAISAVSTGVAAEIRQIAKDYGISPEEVRKLPEVQAVLQTARRELEQRSAIAAAIVEAERLRPHLGALARAPGQDAIEREARRQLEGPLLSAAFVLYKLLKLGPTASLNQAYAAVRAAGIEAGASTLRDHIDECRAQMPLGAASLVAMEITDGQPCAPAEYPRRLSALLRNDEECVLMLALEPAVRRWACKHKASRSKGGDRILTEAQAVEILSGVPEEPLPPDLFPHA